MFTVVFSKLQTLGYIIREMHQKIKGIKFLTKRFVMKEIMLLELEQEIDSDNGPKDLGRIGMTVESCCI